MTLALPVARGVFVTGTGTGIGKTVASAAMVLRWQAEYWKPVQTGVAEDTPDSDTVATLTGAVVHPPRHVFRAPLSPEAASALEGASVELANFNLPACDAPLVVEGAGGVLVPLSAKSLMIDLMVRLAMPVVLVSATGLGTINHTLLSLAALRARHLTIAGVLMVGDDNPGNRDAIMRHGAVRVVHTLPILSPLTGARLAEEAAQLPPLDALLS